MPYTYTLTTVIPATPQEIYRAWLDSEAHSEMTGGEAIMSNEVGAEVSAWDGYITGTNLELVPGERIVQSWRTSEFTDEHKDSIVTVMLEPMDEGTLLTLIHSNVPDDQTSYEEGGWESQYFEPMKVYFAGIEQEEAATEPPEPALSPPEPEPPRASAETAHRAVPPVKVTGAKRKPRKASAKAKRGTAKPRAKKARRATPKRSVSKRTTPKRSTPKSSAPKSAARKSTAPKRAAAKRKSASRKRARR